MDQEGRHRPGVAQGCRRLTAGEGVAAVLAVLGTLGITWYVPNRETKGQA